MKCMLLILGLTLAIIPAMGQTDPKKRALDLVTATSNDLSTEFVCIPRPLERSEGSDGGPLTYRVLHRTSLWKAGERPKLEQQVLEGNPQYSIR